MDLRYFVVFFIGLMMIFISHNAVADSSQIPWKITIKKNGTNANDTIFWPNEIQARQGDSIMWINNDTTAHTVTSGMPDHMNYSGKIFDSGILDPGKQYTFDIPQGVWSAYYYFCKIHPWMTGKIDVEDAYLGKSSEFIIMTDKTAYSINDNMQISGTVNGTYQHMPLAIQIFDDQRNMVFSDSTIPHLDRTYVYDLKVANSIFKKPGNFKIKGYYGFPATVTDANFLVNQNVPSGSNSPEIPHWVKNNAKWWSQNQISDGDFIKGIQFLVTTGDLKTAMSTSQSPQSDTIPAWIRSSAGWWSDGKISDNEFLSGIQYLIDHGIINV